VPIFTLHRFASSLCEYFSCELADQVAEGMMVSSCEAMHFWRFLARFGSIWHIKAALLAVFCREKTVVTASFFVETVRLTAAEREKRCAVRTKIGA